MPDGCCPLLNERLFGSATIGGLMAQVSDGAGPVAWDEVFGRSAPLAIEIGFKRGQFLLDLARQRPGLNLLGIERRRRFCESLVQRLCRDADAPKNVRLIWADAKRALGTVLVAESCSEIYINFPDPWWKRRHSKRRLVDSAFAAVLTRLLKPGGKIWIKSDVARCASEILETLAAEPGISPPVEFGQADLPLTHRERACVEAGRRILRYWVQRDQGAQRR